MSSLEASQGLSTFIRQYAQSPIHAVTGTLLTLFGLLTFINRAFVAVAIAVYVLPPVYLYFTADKSEESGEIDEAGETETEAEGEPGAGIEGATREPEAGTGTAEAPTGGARADSTATANETSAAANTAGESDEPAASADRVDTEPASTGTAADTEGPNTTATETATTEPTTAATAEQPGDTDTGVEGGVDASSVASTAGGAGRAEDSDTDDRDRGWTESDSPTDEGLTDVVVTDDGPYAVGTGGVVLASENDGWEVALERGPTTESNDLRGAGVSDDGRHLWFAGDSGVLGQYDVEESYLTDYSAPLDITNNWTDVAVVGPADGETIYLVDGSGQVLRGENDGGEFDWNQPEVPGSGSSMTSVEFTEEAGYLCDTNAGVYETTDDGGSYDRIGIEDAGADFTDIAPLTREAISVACDDGTVFRYDGTTWTKLYAGETALHAIDRRDGHGFAAGAEGAIYERTGGGWEPDPTPIEAALYGVAIDTDGGAVAVGEDGTIIEYGRA